MSNLRKNSWKLDPLDDRSMSAPERELIRCFSSVERSLFDFLDSPSTMARTVALLAGADRVCAAQILRGRATVMRSGLFSSQSRRVTALSGSTPRLAPAWDQLTRGDFANSGRRIRSLKLHKSAWLGELESERAS